jgi:tRNA (cytidine/uridine-2'-O-)-methyltransferase
MTENVEAPSSPLESENSYEPCLHVVLHQPEIPPNTGNIGRTCVAIGAKLWLIRPLGFDISEKARRRAGLDYWSYLQWQVVDSWDEMLTNFLAPRLWLFTKTATRAYTEVRYQPGDVLVFGKETAGLPKELLERYADRCLRIPMRPQVRSLNLSCSVGVAAFEAVRQIQLPSGGLDV